MSRIIMSQPVGGPILIVGLCAALAGYQAALAQDAEVQFLEPRSMLFQAGEQAKTISGTGEQWRHQYGDPQPQNAVKAASVWLLHYPPCVIPAPGKSVIGTWADPKFWDTIRDIGIDLLHTDPVERGGGIKGRDYTPSIDGLFDRISYEIDPALGTEQEFRQMVQVAAERGGSVGGDLVPLHTGLGPDFRLAQRAYKDYPGVYTMVEIREEDWGLLPSVGDEWSTAIVSKETAGQLTNKGYIPGLINSADANPDAKSWSGWSATGEVVGVDGKRRRWVYLHVFKPGQPAINWLDPSYAGRRVAIGDAVRNIHDLGNRVVRLDAVPFLGIEPSQGNLVTRYFMHPLAVIGTDDLAFMVRKIGGFSFEELNVPVEQYKDFIRNGPDLSYDFFTRAEAIHPILSRDARPLRFEHQELLRQGANHGALIHDLQNHDEITYQLVNLGSRGAIQLGNEKVTGPDLKERILNEMRSGVAGDNAPFNKLYRPEKDGIATTFAGFIAPALGIKDPYHATPDQVRMIQRGHVLLVMANAMQPGVFGVSSWDLVGALPIPEQSVADRTQDGDFRWVNRGGVDLLGVNPQANKSVVGLPKAQALYGTLPEQLGSPNSFASQLKKILAARKKYRIAESQMAAAPDVDDRAVVVLVMKLPDNGGVAITALNYGREPSSATVDFSQLQGISGVQGQAHDVVSDQDAESVSGSQLTIQLDALAGRTLVVQQNR
jgi:maltose alpha-D-glucosyltransferase/alpha-amylase